MNTAVLLAATQPVDGSSAAEFLSFCARISNPANRTNYKTGAKLLKSLIRDAHWSPLEMVNVVIEVTTTRDISRQIIRHTSFKFQEFSQRYAEAPQEPVYREGRLQDKKNRQNSISTNDDALSSFWKMTQETVIRATSKGYIEALHAGIAKEQARVLLPEGMTSTVISMNGTLRSWVHYCMLRRANGTQKEHMEVANQCWEIIKELFPDISEAVEEMEKATFEAKRALTILEKLKELHPGIVADTIKKIGLDITS